MLKSLITQFVATLFFGPIGLVYSSVAGAVFLTLIFAVLYFTELGILAALLVWPIAIIAGLICVKLHNDQIRSSGSKLLLGPGDEQSALSALGSWGRGVAVMALIGVVGYLALWNGSGTNNGKLGRIVDSPVVDSDTVDSGQLENDSAGVVADLSSDISNNATENYTLDTDPETPVVTTSSEPADSSFTVVSLDQQEITPVVIGTSSSAPDVSIGAVLYVEAEVVNLRKGPGTSYSILTQVERGDELSEIERDGSWINVIDSNTGAAGWIFGRLVSSQQ